METINYAVSPMPLLKSNMEPESQNQQMEGRRYSVASVEHNPRRYCRVLHTRMKERNQTYTGLFFLSIDLIIIIIIVIHNGRKLSIFSPVKTKSVH